jgi:hypothetical protein
MGKRLSTSDLEGTWVRTDPPDRGIARVVVEAAGDGLLMRVTSAGGTGPADWGAAGVDSVYAASPEAKAGVAFTAHYDLGDRKVDLHANLSKGLLIIASLAYFSDGRGREFARDFFRKIEGPSS